MNMSKALNKSNWCGVLLTLALLFPASLCAQTRDASPPVSTVFAVLTKSVESKTATVGQELTLRTISDVSVNGVVIIPKGSQLLGRVTEVIAKSRETEPSISVVIEKAVKADGSVLPVQAIIAAIAAPQKKSLANDPAFEMMHSNEPKMIGSTSTSTSSSGTLSPSSKGSSNPAVTTAGVEGAADESPTLNENSQGALGYEGLSLSWRLLTPPPVTVFATKSKNLKLEAGTQMLLRMAPPRASK
jgi:hypothetical protein